MIEGVQIRDLVTHPDDRGYFREIIRVTDDFFGEGFGQWSVSEMFHGAIKAWHIHRKQIDWWYVHKGALKVVLHDMRDGSRTSGVTEEFFLGDNFPPRVLRIPPGIAHGCKCINGPAMLFYVTSHVYDPADEGRIPHDDPGIGYDWLAAPTIK